MAAGHIGHFSTIAAALILVFFGSILLNIVDTCYLCYAIDMDREVVTKEEVHNIFSKVSLVRAHLAPPFVLHVPMIPRTPLAPGLQAKASKQVPKWTTARQMPSRPCFLDMP